MLLDDVRWVSWGRALMGVGYDRLVVVAAAAAAGSTVVGTRGVVRENCWFGQALRGVG